MYGDHATALVHHLYKSSSLPPYSEHLVRQVTEEINELYTRLVRLLERVNNDLTDPKIGGTAIFFHRIILRNKRCVLAYLLDRFYRLRESRYLSLPEQWEENTSASERELLGQYEQLVATYSDNMQIDVSSYYVVFISTSSTISRSEGDQGLWNYHD
ncbi:GINS complex subunit 1 [Galdieria sulphuraria]|uniref:GINS complex subunit 1 n=1 Tax=Galdieria sulphuraria TaxID=130081 RepID=M2Y3U2_GALSU|nr:GINS complex subunit 1 [Galdieria sulphuraria]EME30489.1 GINS complex subunit 1 [Galdieria sulphuraria]|eukprot:XP_005707009.1 GINS complex subunit 1 [Galdieria sulphuraria]